MKSALITGGAGFIGSHLANKLVDEGWSVNLLIRPSTNLKTRRVDLTRIQIHIHDNSIESLRAILKKCNPEIVFHLSSLFISEHEPKDVPLLIADNINFPSMLLEAMRIEGIKKIVNTGTSWENLYGKEYCPVNLYAATKKAFEDILEYYVLAHKFNAINLKISDSYGPADIRKKLINILIRAAKSNEKISLSPGEQEIDLLHVKDICAAFINAGNKLDKDYFKNSCFAVSSGSPLTIKSLVKLIENTLNVNILVEWGARPYRQREVMKFSQSEPMLTNWKPSIDIRKGIVECWQDQLR